MAKKPSVNKLSSRYAEAFFALAVKGKNSSALVSQIREIAEIFAGSKELSGIIKNSSVSAVKIKAAISEILQKSNADSLVQNLIETLAENRRLSILPKIAGKLFDMQVAHDGMEKVHIISAAKLSDENIRAIDHELTVSVGKRLAITTEIDPKILGGIIINIGSKMLDNSVKGRLERLRLHLKNSTSKAA
jgi:F-type H+-transporting ATPase subunit delta